MPFLQLFRYACAQKSGHDGDEAVRDCLEFIGSSFSDRTLGLRKDFPLCRAQIATGSYEHELYGNILGPCDKERLIPDASKVRGGRANPPGTAYLYMATKDETAMHEVRPWIGSCISLGLFAVSRDMKIINCCEFQGRSEHEPLLKNISISPKEGWKFRELSEAQLLETEWIHVDNAFFQPVSNNEDQSNYKPTQKIAEFIKQSGSDGIA